MKPSHSHRRLPGRKFGRTSRAARRQEQSRRGYRIHRRLGVLFRRRRVGRPPVLATALSLHRRYRPRMCGAWSPVHLVVTGFGIVGGRGTDRFRYRFPTTYGNRGTAPRSAPVPRGEPGDSAAIPASEPVRSSDGRAGSSRCHNLKPGALPTLTRIAGRRACGRGAGSRYLVGSPVPRRRPRSSRSRRCAST